MQIDKGLILKSKTYLFAKIIAGIFCLFISFWILIYVTIVVFGENFSPEKIFTIIPLFVPFIMLKAIGNFFQRILIFKNAIVVRYFFYKKSISYKEVDSVISVVESGKGGSYEVLYLFADRKPKLRISSSLYKNFDQIKSALCEKLPYKGLVKISFLDSFRLFWGREIKKMEILD